MGLIFRNRKIKFSEADYIDKHYIDGDNAIIPINLDSIDELYMKHDFKKLALSDEICKYIEEIAYIIPLKYHIVLEIHSPKIDEQEQLSIKKVIKNNYGMEIDDRDYDVRVAYHKCISMCFLGAFFLIVAYTFDNYLNDFIKEVISIAGWVALWEMFECLMLDNAKKKTERINNLQLYDSEIRFVFDKRKKHELEDA